MRIAEVFEDDDGFDPVEHAMMDERVYEAIHNGVSWTPRPAPEVATTLWWDPRAARSSVEAVPAPSQDTLGWLVDRLLPSSRAEMQPSAPRGPDDWWRRQHP